MAATYACDASNGYVLRRVEAEGEDEKEGGGDGMALGKRFWTKFQTKGGKYPFPFPLLHLLSLLLFFPPFGVYPSLFPLISTNILARR